MDEAEEVLDALFPAGNKSAVVVRPGEEPFHLPAFFVAPQLASILCLLSAPPIRGDQFDAVFFREPFVEPVRVVGLVANESCGQLVEEASGQNLFDKLALVRRSTLDRYGERKIVTSGDSEDLRPLAAAGGANGKPPFFALAKVASTNASSRFSWPRSRRCRASRRNASCSLPLRTHC